MNRTRKLVILLCLVVLGLSTIYTAVYYPFSSSSSTGISVPDIVLESGISGTSTVYSNGTSASITVDSYSTTFYPNNYNITTGQYVSGSTPSSINQIDDDYFTTTSVGSNTTENLYYPNNYNLLGNTNQTSGSINNLTLNDQVYMTYQSYRSNTNTTHYVDNNSSNIDSIPNIGAFTDFSNQQTGPDLQNDTLIENNVQINTTIDYIDLNDSNIDNQTIYGSHSNFTATRLTDGTYDTLTESQIVESETLDCNAYDSTYTQWNTVGTSPWLDAQDQPSNYVWVRATTGQQIGWFGFENTSLTGYLMMNLSIYCRNEDGASNDAVRVFIDFTGSGSGTEVGSVAQHTVWQYDTFDLGNRSVSEVNNFRLYLKDEKIGGPDDVYVDHMRISVYNMTYRLDREVYFTNVPQSYDETELCIKTGSTGTENLSLSIWNSTSSTWTQLANDLPDSNWLNTTITDYINDTTYLRFMDSDIDYTQTSWQMDGILLKQYNLSYQLDLEVQWTGVIFNDTHEYLCIYAGELGSEDILVDVWSNSTWINLYTDLSPGWNNISISSYLNSSTFTLRLRDYIKDYDHSQDQWDIDVSLLNTWTDEFTSEVEFQGTSNLYNWDTVEVTIDSGWSNNSVNAELQLYNYQTASYETSGEAYTNWTSGVNNTDETKVLLISGDATDYRNATGGWRVKLKGVKYDFNYPFYSNIDYIRFNVSHFIEYTCITEFLFDGITDSQSPHLNFTTVTHNSVDGATITLQVWNYTTSSYPSSGQGYASFVSTGANNTQWLNISTTPSSCINVTDAKIRVTSVHSTTQDYQNFVNFIRLLQDPIQKTHNYSLRVKNQGADTYNLRLISLSETGLSRLINCTILLNSTTQIR